MGGAKFVSIVQIFLSMLLILQETTTGCKCFEPFEHPIKEKVISKLPHSYLKEEDLPLTFDVRNINGTNYGSHVLNQMAPSVCGSCWAEAATGALTDR